MKNLEIKKGHFIELEIGKPTCDDMAARLYGAFGSREEATACCEKLIKEAKVNGYEWIRKSIYEDSYIQVGDKIFMQRDIEPINED